MCLVVAVADGDTLTARCQGFEEPGTVQVRLAEIDEPERRQAFGERSRLHLRTLCLHQRAELRPVTRDRYGRMVARVSCAGVDASRVMVRDGMAWRFVDHSTDEAFVALEDAARSRRRGLWWDAEPVAPWMWRRARRAPAFTP